MLESKLEVRGRDKKSTKYFNRFSWLIGNTPEASPKRVDSLKTTDINGATSDTYGKLWLINGWDYLNISDIPGAHPSKLTKTYLK